MGTPLVNLPAILNPVIDKIRGIADANLGLRSFSVIQRTVTWTQGRPGLGTPTIVNTPVLVASFPYGAASANPKVKAISQREIFLSGGLYQDRDMRIGPLTPPYTSPVTGGMAYQSLDPPVTGATTEVFYKLTWVGPGVGPLPANGEWFVRFKAETDSNLHIYEVVRATATQSPGGQS